MTTNGPLPTALVLINQLHTQGPGSKVRFLGCVVQYDVKRGVLALQHACPPPPHRATVALVDVTLLLETLAGTDTQVGEWVNVIGYVAAPGDKGSRAGGAKGGGETGRGRRDDAEGRGYSVRVQAIMLWSAGSVKIEEYERALAERQRVANLTTVR